MTWASECKWVYLVSDIREPYTDDKGNYHEGGVLFKACDKIRWAYKYNSINDTGGNDYEIDCYLARKCLSIPPWKILRDENLNKILKWLNGERE